MHHDVTAGRWARGALLVAALVVPGAALGRVQGFVGVDLGFRLGAAPHVGVGIDGAVAIADFSSTLPPYGGVFGRVAWYPGGSFDLEAQAGGRFGVVRAETANTCSRGYYSPTSLAAEVGGRLRTNGPPAWFAGGHGQVDAFAAEASVAFDRDSGGHVADVDAQVGVLPAWSSRCILLAMPAAE